MEASADASVLQVPPLDVEDPSASVSAFPTLTLTGTYQPPVGEASIDVLKARLRLAAAALQPAIFKRKARESEMLQEVMGIRVPEWTGLKKHNGRGPVTRYQPVNALNRTGGRRHTYVAPDPPGGLRSTLPKLSRAVKSKANGSGRTYTSKYRGVHQTFPTKRWEAQFRRNGKPTSLGCFDHEEEAARAYDKMMLWCELHNTAGVKGGITNFDPSEYEKDLNWLTSVTQDELIESLRSDGRRQAAHRMLRQKREGQSTAGESEPDDGQEVNMGSDAGDDCR